MGVGAVGVCVPKNDLRHPFTFSPKRQGQRCISSEPDDTFNKSQRHRSLSQAINSACQQQFLSPLGLFMTNSTSSLRNLHIYPRGPHKTGCFYICPLHKARRCSWVGCCLWERGMPRCEENWIFFSRGLKRTQHKKLMMFVDSAFFVQHMSFLKASSEFRGLLNLQDI